MVPSDDLNSGDLRLLEVDNQVILPGKYSCKSSSNSSRCNTLIGCNALGIKTDAYPGRLNQVSMVIKREGTYYGQCSEICGVLHG